MLELLCDYLNRRAEKKQKAREYSECRWRAEVEYDELWSQTRDTALFVYERCLRWMDANDHYDWSIAKLLSISKRLVDRCFPSRADLDMYVSLSRDYFDVRHKGIKDV